MPNKESAFQIVAGWRGQQPGGPAVGSACLTGRQVSSAHMKQNNATIWNTPNKNAGCKYLTLRCPVFRVLFSTFYKRLHGYSLLYAV